MNPISILWIAAGLCALVLAADGLLSRYLRRTGSAAGPVTRFIPFSALMLVLGVGCVILGVYEATASP